MEQSETKPEKQMNILKRRRETRTISFEPLVLENLEKFCKENNTTPSTFVNHTIKQVVINEVEFARAMAKHHAREFNKWKSELDICEGKFDSIGSNL